MFRHLEVAHGHIARTGLSALTLLAYAASVASASREGVSCNDEAGRPRQTVGAGPGALRAHTRRENSMFTIGVGLICLLVGILLGALIERNMTASAASRRERP